MEVHQQLGCGFLEAVYQEALAYEMQSRRIPFQREITLPVFYKGHKLSTSYRTDFICFDEVIVELKAIKELTSITQAQTINYLKITKMKKGLLINFGAESLEVKRYVN